MRLGLGWAKSHSFTTGQCPVKRYNRQLMNLILADKAHIAKAVNATTISLDEAPTGYRNSTRARPRSTCIDPHGMVRGLTDERSLMNSQLSVLDRTLADFDPEVAAADRARAGPPAVDAGDDRVGELRPGGGACRPRARC